MHLLGFPLQLKMQIFLSHFYMMLMMQIILITNTGCYTYGEASLWLGSDSSSVISGRSVFVSSNSENISFVTFLKHKTAENRELSLWHLVNRLVPKNA
jgi:hypothetical protein